MDCVFCKIIKDEVPCYKIYEDEETLAFLSIADDYYGHTLVIPKKHFESMLDCPENILAAVTNTVKKVSQHYVSLGYDGINVFTNNGASAGQIVFHLHMHVVPRKKDAPHNWASNSKINRDLAKEQKHLILPI